MKKVDAMNLCAEKIAELKSTIASLKTNDQISKATRGTQLYARGRERRVLNLINTLIGQIKGDDVNLETADLDTLVLITTLASERQDATFACHEGESLLDLMQRYPKRSMDQLEKALDRFNYAIDKATLKIIKK